MSALVCHINNPRGSAQGTAEARHCTHGWRGSAGRICYKLAVFQKMLLLKRFCSVFRWIWFSFTLPSFSITETVANISPKPYKGVLPRSSSRDVESDISRVCCTTIGVLSSSLIVWLLKSAMCCSGNLSWDVHYWVSKLRIGLCPRRLMSRVLNDKHSTPVDFLSVFWDETLLLINI